MKYYDLNKKQIICIEEAATAGFWGERWEITGELIDTLRSVKKTFAVETTRKYLRPEDGVILEGGCGMGINVAGLKNNGYKCIGVDYARRTVDALNQKMPVLDIRFADVKKLPFADDFFIAYWSWGVIEHFYQGYEEILLEAKRVLKKDGYLFLVFPHMSFLRKLKAMMGKYDFWKGAPTEKFYQFMLNQDLVIRDCKKAGFRLVEEAGFDGIKGAKNELSLLQKPLQKLYSCKNNSFFIKALRKGLDISLAVFASHSSLLVLKKA